MRLKATFAGVNSDLPLGRTASGSARAAHNVEVSATTVGGRRGFGVFDVTGAESGPILSMGAVEFAKSPGGTPVGTYLLVKRAGDPAAVLYTTRVDLGITGWGQIVDPWGGLANTDPGSYFVHGDRICHVDSKGVTKWHPQTTYKPAGGSLAAWKGGIASTKGAVIEAAVGGAMQGHYRAAVVKRNFVTKEHSCIQDLQAEAVSTRASDGDGALTVTNWNTAVEGVKAWAPDALYEWDEAVLYRSMGNTQKRHNKEAPAYLLHEDIVVNRAATDNPALARSDQSLSLKPQYVQRGGLPPGARFCCYNGSQALYADIYWGGLAVPGQLMYSLPGHPCMVPGDQTYGPTGGFTETLRAQPFEGMLNAAIAGQITGVGAAGQAFVVSTKTGVYYVRPTGEGRMVARRTSAAEGALSELCTVTTPFGVHVVGSRGWHFCMADRLRNIAEDRFEDVLAEVPTALRAQSVAAAYTYRNEVWVAVSRANCDCDRLMVYNAATDEYALTAASAAAEEYTCAYQLFPDEPTAGDRALFGWSAKPSPSALTVVIGRPATYLASAVLSWKYLATDQTWKPLAITGDTTNPDDASGGRPFVREGQIAFNSPADWAYAAVNGVSAYWIAAEVAAGKAANITSIPLMAHHLPTRILVLDETRMGDEADSPLMAWYDPLTLLGSFITAMCELKVPNAEPAMLIGLADGRILRYPSLSDGREYRDHDGAGYWKYPTEWKGCFGQERRQERMRLNRCGLTPIGAGHLSISAAGMATGKDAGFAPADKTVSCERLIDWSGADFDPYQCGRMFEVRLWTTGSQETDDSLHPDECEWEATDLLLEIDRA